MVPAGKMLAPVPEQLGAVLRGTVACGVPLSRPWPPRCQP